MKLTARQYAEALFDITLGKNEKELPLILKNFLGILVKNRAMILIPRIIAEYENVCDDRDGVVRAKLITYKKLSAKIKNVVKESVGKNVVIEEQVSPEIMGGLIIRIKDTIIDGSIKTSLKNLGQSMASGEVKIKIAF